MNQAIAIAHLTKSSGDVPVGALIINKDGVIIGKGSNEKEANNDPTAHAEIVALRAAARAAQNYRLPGATLYVTLEPCAMCLGAMLHARVGRIVFAAADPKTGACGSVVNLLEHASLNHQTTAVSGVLAEECGQYLRDFFRDRRGKTKQGDSPEAI
jgi:tRNA(adenine34) deaminase